jgi:hypothetical protein
MIRNSDHFIEIQLTYKRLCIAGHWCLRPVILVTSEAKIGRIAVQGQVGQIV